MVISGPGTRDGTSADSVELARLVVDESATAAGSPTHASHRVEFNASRSHPTQLWSKSSPLGSIQQHQEEALKLVAELSKALATRDIDTLDRLLSLKATELATCYGLPPEAARGRQREFLLGVMGDSNWSMPILEPSALKLHIVAEGRLIWVTRGGRSAALRSDRGGGVSFELPVYLGLIDGRLAVLR